MTTFEEQEHPRGRDGKFATKDVPEQPAGLDALASPGELVLADDLTEVGTVVVDGPWRYVLVADPAEDETPWVDEEGERHTLDGAMVEVVRQPFFRPAPSVSPEAVGPLNRIEEGGVVTFRDADGRPHRDDGPAVTFDDTELWYHHGSLHRDGGPALTHSRGEEWYQRGALHRDDGPASTNHEGVRLWSRYNVPHREDGPAVERTPEYAARNVVAEQEWYREGRLHREDGPAVTNPDVLVERTGAPKHRWYIDGEDVSPQPGQRWRNSDHGHRHETVDTEDMLAEPRNGWRREYDPRAREFVVHTPSGDLRRYQAVKD